MGFLFYIACRTHFCLNPVQLFPCIRPIPLQELIREREIRLRCQEIWAELGCMSIERRIAHFVVNFRWIMLLILLGCSVFLGFKIVNDFSIDHNLLDQLAQDDPDLITLREFEETFGQSDMLVVTLEADNIFTDPVLEELNRITLAFEDNYDLESVDSLANAKEMRQIDGVVVAEPLLESYQLGDITLEQFREIVMANPAIVGNYVSEDGTVAAINLYIASSLVEDTPEVDREELMGKVQAVLDTVPDTYTVALTGPKAIISDAITYMSLDVQRYFWVTPLLMGLLLILLFRRFSAVVVPIVLIIFSVIWALGVFFLSGHSLGLATTLMPTLIALITLSDAIHALSHYYGDAFPEGYSKKERILETMEHMISACFMTSITTAVGIGSLVTSPVKSVHEFGIWAAIGIAFAYILVMALLPLLLSILPTPRNPKEKPPSATKWGKLLNFEESNRTIIWVGTFVVTLVSIYFAFQVKIEAQLSAYLPDQAPSLAGLKVVDERMSGVGNLELQLNAEPGTFQQVWAIEEVDELQKFLETLPGVNQVYSPASIIREVHRTLSEVEVEPGALPTENAQIEDYFFFLSASAWADRLESFVTSDYAKARINSRVENQTTMEYEESRKKIVAFAKENLDPRIELITTGRLKLFSANVNALVSSLMRSLTWTFALIALLLLIHFRSLKIALVSLLPNLIPVVVPLAVMGVGGIPLNAATVMVSCLVIGLAVDNAIHFLARYRRETASGLSVDEALQTTLAHTGKAIVIVSVVIAGGFTVFLFSSFAPNRYFGLLVALAMLTAPVVDLLLLPLLIRLFRVK